MKFPLILVDSAQLQLTSHKSDGQLLRLFGQPLLTFTKWMVKFSLLLHTF